MADSKPAAAVVVAAGAGRRFGSGGVPKQFVELLGRPLLDWAVRPFVDHPAVARVVLVLPPSVAAAPPTWLERLGVTTVAGGARRSDSVRRGVAELDAEVGTVLIHDGARPFVSRTLIDRVLDAALGGVAVVPGLPITDTVKQVDDAGNVVRTVPRDRLRRVQTPQAFPLATLRELHHRAVDDGFYPTDDAGLFEEYGLPVLIVEGDPFNLKVTRPMDLVEAEFLAQRLPVLDPSRADSHD